MTLASWPAKETLRLAKLQGYHILDTPGEPAYDDIAALAAYICQTPTALVSLVDASRQWFKAKVGLEADETPLEGSFCLHTIQQSDVMVVEDALQDPFFRDTPLVVNAPHIRFYAGAPLITPDGHAIGSLCVIDYRPRQLGESQRRALQMLSHQVVAQMELTHHAQRLSSAHEHLEQRVQERTVRLTSALHRLLKTQAKLLKREAALRHSSLHDPLTDLPNRSYFLQRLEQSIQLVSREPNRLYAVLFIDLDDFKPVNDVLGHEVGDLLLQHVADQIKLLLRKSDLVARLGGDEFAVLLDDIPNQEHAIAAVNRLQKQLRQPFVIDKQKVFVSASIGITFSSIGYRQPEAALRDADIAMYHAKKQTKQRAKAQLEAQVKPQTSSQKAFHQRQNLQNRQPHGKSGSASDSHLTGQSNSQLTGQLNGQLTHGNHSVGTHRAPIVIQDDVPLGGQQFAIFDAAMQGVARARLTLEDELRQALLKHEFHLYYQPIFNLAPNLAPKRVTQQLTSFEVLLRWHHPTRGCLEAEAFIAIAEEIGIVRQLGDYIIQTACAQLKQWRQRSGSEQLALHINLSSLQIRDAKLFPYWQTMLSQYQLPASAFQIEIDEQILLSSDPTITAELRQLKALGFGLCVDDFGRGHSSLSRLHQLEVDALKIDRAFIQALATPGGSDIVKTIVDLGRSANMRVIAEGIETAEHLQFLMALGCEFGQGYWLSAARSATATDQALSTL
jgi:diguanylate cyclase (GGDEF)-like protein